MGNDSVLLAEEQGTWRKDGRGLYFELQTNVLPGQITKYFSFCIILISYTHVANESCRIMNHIITSQNNMFTLNVFEFLKDDMRIVGNLPKWRVVVELYAQYQGICM